MRRYLVVANQTLQRTELRDELRKRIDAGPSSFYLLVPDTRAADYPDPAATAGVLQPSMTWWMTDYRGPATEEEASTQARQRLGQMLADLSALGVPAEGDLGSAQPAEAMEKLFADRQFDEIIVATLPGPSPRYGPTCHIGPSAGSGYRSRPSSPSAGPGPTAASSRRHLCAL